MSAASTPGLVLGGEPRVQLLPPSVKQREKVRSARRLMVLFVILAAVVAGAGTFGAYWLAQQAEGELAAEQARTLDLLAEQGTYAEGATVAGQVAGVKAAQLAVTANEIDWLDLASRVLPLISCDCSRSVSFSGPAPFEPALIPEGPLRPARIATMTIELKGSEFLSATSFVAAVRAMPEIADAVITATASEDGEYRTTIVLTFDSDALAHRFGDTPAPSDGSDVGGGSTGDAPAATPEPASTEGSNQ